MKFTRIMAVVLTATALICGNAVITNAGNEPSHKHTYTVGQYERYGSNPGTAHPYLIRYEIDQKSGTIIPVYGTCYTSIIKYRAPYVCNCGARNGDYDYKNVEVHSNCGQ